MTLSTSLIFAVLSLVFAVLSARDYLRNGRPLSISARIWLRMALIFAVTAVLLVVFV